MTAANSASKLNIGKVNYSSTNVFGRKIEDMFMKKAVSIVVALVILSSAISAMALEGSAKFSLAEPMICAGTEIKAGQYDVKYQSSSPEATVTFMVEGKIIATVQGKIEELQKKNSSSSVLIGKDSSGRPTILGMQFGGKKIQINF